MGSSVYTLPSCSGSGVHFIHTLALGVQDPDSPTPPSWQPKPPLSPSCVLITRSSCLTCQLTGRDQHLGIRQAKPAPLIGQDILCSLSRPFSTTAWVDTKDRVKSTSPALYRIPFLSLHKPVVLYSYPSWPLMLMTYDTGVRM